VSRGLDSRQARIAAFVAVGAVIAAWLVLVARQVADGGFYSDDWAIQWDWATAGYSGALSDQFRVLGSKPLLAFALPGAYEVLGTDPAWHHVLAAVLVLTTIALFYLVLRELRFETRDAVPIALLALLFPWATGVRFWPTGSLNNLAILALFAGFLIAMRGLRVGGRKGLLLHVVAAACYAASVLFYETTTAVAAMLWPAYVWVHGWRPALPRAAMDVSAVGAAAIYSLENTNKDTFGLSEQIGHVPKLLREGADLIAGSLLPVELPARFPTPLMVVVVGVAIGVFVLVLLRRGEAKDGAASQSGAHWVTVAGIALAALALCWAVYIPQAFYTPTFQGIEDRVNVVALFPAAVLVWAFLRAAGSLFRGRGYQIAIAGAVAIALGYWLQDLRQQRDYARAAELEESVLAAVERASPPDYAVVLTFGHPAQIRPGVPVFNQTYDLWPAAQLRTGTDGGIHTYPVFEGARLRCTPKGVALDFLATPFYRVMNLRERGTDKLQGYGNVMFVNVADGRRAVIGSREQCSEALREFPPGPSNGDLLFGQARARGTGLESVSKDQRARLGSNQ
jgi:hypothetical protein